MRPTFDPSRWTPPEDFLRFTTLEVHTGGEPLRIITSGFPEPPGETMLDKREYARTHFEPLRRALMLEPRGHADMYGCLFTQSTTSDGDFGVLFLHNEGYSTMCGHGIIALVTAGIECGMFAAKDELRIDTPAGRVTARPHLEDGRVVWVSFRNVASFLLERDLSIEVTLPGAARARLLCDVAFGGAFYAYVDAARLGLDPKDVRTLIDAGMRLKHAVAEQYVIRHPAGDPELEFLYGTIFVWPGGPGEPSRNVCVFAEGEVDRSPTGTGVSGRAAIHHARGELAQGVPLSVESIVGSRFEVRVVETTRVGALPAVIPEVTGSAYLTGRHEFFVDPNDPFAQGFLLR